MGATLYVFNSISGKEKVDGVDYPSKKSLWASALSVQMFFMFTMSGIYPR